MSIDFIDILWRIERHFGVKVEHEEWTKLVMKNDPPDVLVGDLFEFVRIRAFRAGVLDEELDGEAILWAQFQQLVSDSLGVDLDEVIKDRGFIHDLGAT